MYKIMKRSKKQPRVSWPPGPKLCQVKMFRKEDCPAKVGSQPQRRGPDLPPGFERNLYAADKPNIRQIKWKRPPKFLLNDSWLIGAGGESTERLTENLRISKLFEAVYPHRSAIPSRPSVSPAVEAECFDDSKTPTIRVTPIEDDCESGVELSSRTSLESGFNPNKQDQLETKLPCSIDELVAGLAPDLTLAASAALTALKKTKEQGSMVDPDLLIRILSDPEIIKSLIGDKTGKSSETKTQVPTIDTNINPERPVPQHVTASPMARMPQPMMRPREEGFATSVPFTYPEERRLSPPKPGYGNIFAPKQINGNPMNIPIPVQSCVGLAKQPSLPPRLMSSSIPVNLNHLQRPQHAFPEQKVMIVNPQPQPQPNFGFRTSELNNVQPSIGFPKVPQTGFNTYPMNFNRVDSAERLRPVVQPMRSVDYFKNLIKEHGTDNHETNPYHSQTGTFSGHGGGNAKVEKQCAYFNSPRGCKLGESCIYAHDHRFRPNFEAETPMAKRMKFGRYDKNGL